MRWARTGGQRRGSFIDSLALFYVSPHARVSEAGLRERLSGQLPAYRVPGRIQRLDRLPLTGDGEPDRALLESIISVGEPACAPSDDPRGATEIAIAGVFSAVLGMPAVPRTVPLLDLGGDSLAVAAICARLERATGVPVQTSQLYRTPTVAQLAAWLQTPRPGSPEAAAASAEPAAGDHTPLTPMQGGTVPREMINDMGWWIAGPLDEEALALAVTDVHRRHQGLHACYLVSGLADPGYATLPAGPVTAELHRLPAVATDTEAVGMVREVLKPPFQLDQGKSWRCALVRTMESGRSLFALAIHHATFDGRSATIFAEDLGKAYTARAAGAEPDFGPPPATLAEHHAAYQQRLAAADLGEQRTYWRGEFEGLGRCHLPGRNNAPAPELGPVEAPDIPLEPADLRRWEAYGRNRVMTPFVWVAAALSQALIDAGAPQDLGLMCPTANLGHELLDRTMTCRMGVVFMRPNGPSRTGRHLLARVQDAYNKAMVATDALLDLREVAYAIGIPPPPGAPALQEVPFLNYQKAPLPLYVPPSFGFGEPGQRCFNASPSKMAKNFIWSRTSAPDQIGKMMSRATASLIRTRIRPDSGVRITRNAS